MSHPLRTVRVVLLRSRCASCGSPPHVVCPSCAGALRAAPELAPPAWVDRCRAAFDYETVRPLVTAMKNGDHRALVPWLADHLAGRWRPPPGAVVTWAPTGGARRRRRGFDQAELLARAVARRWGLPCRSLLRRRAGPAQAGRALVERRANPAFEAWGKVPHEVVLIDDVVTSGATLAAAAHALRSAGAQRVTGLAVARAAVRGAR